MKHLGKSYLFIVGILILAGILSWRLYFQVYSQKDTVNIHVFPQQVGEWSSEEIPLTKVEKIILETDNAFVRRYTNAAGEEVYLFIVYSQSNRKVSHPPEICYTGSGATILNKVNQSFEGAGPQGPVKVDGNMMSVEFSRQDQKVFYWFKVGDAYTASYWKQQVLIAIKSFLNKPSSSAMIRLSADVSKKAAPDEAVHSIKDFAILIAPLLSEYLP